MNRVYKAEEAPAIFGADRRPVEIITDASTLKSTGAAFQSNSANKGDKWEFDSLADLLKKNWIRRQATSDSGKNKTTLICGERTRAGKTTLAWFNLGSLNREDINNVPVMPEWHELGNDYLKIEKLHSMGQFEVTDTKKIDVQKWDGAVRVEGETESRDVAIIPWVE
jgi:hypothetical protein